ncbi:MAG TPA: DUF4845 domain-containing protein [Candidatus Acidoferrum sp.]|nr:DUF4845 domain-containing protein [Candidatus Acidoferrum sp.]
MNKFKLNSLSKQRGSFFVTALMLVLLGGALTLVLKLAPAYTSNIALKNSMTAITARSDYKGMSLDEVRNELIKGLRVNAVEGFDAKYVTFAHESSKDYVDIDYEVRVAIVANISAVIEFKNRFDK